MTDVCTKCNESLPDDGSSLTCVVCDYPYHWGICSGITDATKNTKTFRRTWRCQTCVTVQSRGGHSTQPKKDTEVDVLGLLAVMNKKLDSLLTLKETVDGIERSVQLMSDNYDEVLKRINQQDRDVKDLRKRVEVIEGNINGPMIGQLQRDVNELEWRSRKQNLEVHGIPVTENEVLLTKLNEVANVLNVPQLNTNDVISVHRLPARADKLPGIIVHFASEATRNRWFENRLKLKSSQGNTYLQENITKHNRALLWAAKQWAKDNRFQYVWHRNGRILIRKKDGERATVVESENDLLRMA